MISIILPVYNGEKYIYNSVKSVLASNYNNYELIIINDGSNDETENIISKFEDPRIKYYSKQNSGIADSLNYGISKSRHEIIGRMDSDDEMDPNRFIYQLKKLKERVVLVGSNGFLITEENKLFGKTNMPILNYEIKQKILNLKNPIIHPSVIFLKKSFIKSGKYNPEIKESEDYDLWLRMIKQGEFNNCKQPLIKLRKGNYNESIIKAENFLANNLTSLSFYHHKSNKNYFYEKKIITESNYFLILNYLNNLIINSSINKTNNYLLYPLKIFRLVLMKFYSIKIKKLK